MKSRTGFSLIEATVAIAVLSVVTIGIIETMRFGNKGARGIQERIVRLSTRELVQSLLKDSEACSQTVQGVSIVDGSTIASLPSIKDNAGVDRLLLNTPIGTVGGQVTATYIHLKNWNDATVESYSYDSDPATPPNPEEWRELSSAELHITYKKTVSGQSLGGESYIEKFPLVVIRLSGANTVIACASRKQEQIEASCESLGGSDSEPPFCKNLKIEQLATGGATNPALTVRGFTRINSSLGIGVDPTGTTGNLDMSGNLLVQGDSQFGNLPSNTHQFTGGVAIGLGAAPTNQGLGVGVNPPGLGSLAILNNTFLGNNASDEHFVQGSLGIGVAPGNLGGLGVGTAAPGAGNIRASGDLTIAENATISNSGLNNTVNIATGGGTDTVNINSVSGTTNLAGTVKLNNPLVFNTNAFNMLTSIVAADQNRVATIKNISDAVYGYLASGNDDTNKNEIIQKLLEFADKPDTGVNSLRDHILGFVNATCGVGEIITAVRYDGTSVYASGCAASPVVCDPATPGSCSQICTGGECMTTAYSAGASGLSLGDCTFHESVNPLSDPEPPMPATVIASCPAGKVMTGVEIGRDSSFWGNLEANQVRLHCCNGWASSIRK